MTEADLLSAISYVITHLLYAIQDPYSYHDLTISYKYSTPETSLEFTNFSAVDLALGPKTNLKILIHDLDTSEGIKWYDSITEEYFKSEGYAVLAVDYTQSLENATKSDSYSYVREIGVKIGELIVEMNEKYNVLFENVHILGHMAGAHVAGNAGEKVFKETGEYVGRITGLDPSRTAVFDAVESGRLSPHDASFVDVIHASFDSWYAQTGRVDFRMQRYMKCDFQEYRKLKEIAPKIYIESINGNGFKMERCVDMFKWDMRNCEKVKATVGEHVDLKTFGSFFNGNDADDERYCDILGLKAKNDINGGMYYNKYTYNQHQG